MLIKNVYSSSFKRRPQCFQFISKKNKSYIQGQEPEPKVREYFYFIDHQGMVSVYT